MFAFLAGLALAATSARLGAADALPPGWTVILHEVDSWCYPGGDPKRLGATFAS